MNREPEQLAEDELDAFLNQHGDRMYTYLCVYCRGEESAAEALQNAYVKFIEQVRRGRVLRDTAPRYLLTIAKNDYLGRLRRENREVALPEETVDTAAEDRRSREELARDLRLVLLDTAQDASLPEDLTQVIRLRFLEEADIETICRETGRSQATVYRLMEKALGVLAEACRRAGLNPEGAGL